MRISKMLHKVSLLALGMALGMASFLGDAFSQDAKAVVRGTFPSTVLIVMHDSTGNPVSLGTGFSVGPDLIATNFHVVEGGSRGIVKPIGNAKQWNIAGIAGIDRLHDLAILRVSGLSLPRLNLVKNASVSVGEEVFAVGNPQGLEGTVSQGIVSGIRDFKGEQLLQITAPISPGSSGGPVVNRNSEVIGIAVASFKNGQNLNFAVPSKYLLNLVGSASQTLPFVATVKGKSPSSAYAESAGKATEALKVTAVSCKSTNPFLPQMSHWECGMSLVNQSTRPVKNIRIQVVLRSSKGEPIETFERIFHEKIEPGLARRPTEPYSDYLYKIPDDVKRMTAKSEFRILDFAYAD